MSKLTSNWRRSGEDAAARRRPRLLTLGTLLAALGALIALAPTAMAEVVEPSQFAVKQLCADPASGHSGCLGLELSAHAPLSRPDTRPVPALSAVPPSASASERTGAAPNGDALPPGEAADHKAPEAGSLSPANLLAAYGLSDTEPPSQQTIALVDAYNDLNAEADLKVFDAQYGLPECTVGNGCFAQVNQLGEPANLPFPTSAHQLKLASEGGAAEREEAEQATGWALEISTDIEVAHGVCPSCHILLVEADSNENEDLYTAEQSAATLGASEISNSWGGEETGVDYSQFNHPGVVITASAGDNGYLDWLKGKLAKGAEYPASSPHVVAVGGTRLNRNAVTGAWQSETVWNDGGKKNTRPVEPQGAGGGGCSLSFTAPPWQQSLADFSSVGCAGKRAVADVSADADPYSGVAIYDSTEYEQNKGWATIGGTSVASPIIAATFALAGGAHHVAYPAQTLYENDQANPGSLHDVVAGSNGECHLHVNETPGETFGTASCSLSEEAAVCAQQAICLARAGYDGPSGVGTPDGLAAFRPFAEQTSAGAISPLAGVVSAPAPGASEPGNAPVGSLTSTSTAPAPVISALKLTHTALAAVARRRTKLSQVGFSFTLSASTRVRATLAIRVRVHGRLRWRVISAPPSFLASRGSQSRRLSGRATLAPGRYLLTLTPTRGTAKSLQFRIA